jgi:pimeloyl-ACP methyl ester carboxylesterase
MVAGHNQQGSGVCEPANVFHDGFNIYYESLGPADGRPLILVSGSGEQIGSVEFPDEQCRVFAERGFRIIRMDNRDAGLSTPTVELPEIDMEEALSRGAAYSPVPYNRMDMADDIVAVLDDIGIERAHLLGASMGGFLVRWAAVRHPSRVFSLTVVMSGAGAGADDSGPQFEVEVVRRLMMLTERHERDTAIDRNVELWRWLWGTEYPFEEDFVRERVRYAYDRSYRPEGFARQALSSIRSPGLWSAQTKIKCPTLVVHGGSDPCFDIAHGQAIQRQIIGTELWNDPKMGHIMHREQWDELAQRVDKLANSAATVG